MRRCVCTSTHRKMAPGASRPMALRPQSMGLKWFRLPTALVGNALCFLIDASNSILKVRFGHAECVCDPLASRFHFGLRGAHDDGRWWLGFCKG
ncbi:hypothetical protein BDA96_02G100000 [Sorghum bicolor]|uniref:Uncharacterized protein n=1 Tax=Sorghum bicolor TaxID=4558 RepID=A0A921US72_SORBI|nr:hypothetical protein BDA96_02G100000 [Sorghum bicolor]